jgi:hypothetical protein
LVCRILFCTEALRSSFILVDFGRRLISTYMRWNPLITELFSMGFRWAERSRSGGRGLWHPELQIGINIGSGGAPSDLAELSNVLTVINDLDLKQRAQASLKVILIEDLIPERVAGCLILRTPFLEAPSLTCVLVALAREGVGGPFRAGYLQRRVTWETDGAVVLEAPLSSQAVVTSLTRMQALIDSWHVRCGLSFDRPSSATACLRHETTTQTASYRNKEQGRAGGIAP